MPNAKDRFYTAPQAGVLSGLTLKAVHNAIDKRIVRTVEHHLTTRGSRRMLKWSSVVCLRVWDGLGGMLNADLRELLFQAIEARPALSSIRANELVTVDVAAARSQVTARLHDLDAAEAAVHRDRDILGGEPVFKGTRVPVYGIADMLAAGADRTVILAGYPSLDSRMLDLAAIWTAANPRLGRPRRRTAEQPTSRKRVGVIPTVSAPRPIEG